MAMCACLLLIAVSNIHSIPHSVTQQWSLHENTKNRAVFKNTLCFHCPYIANTQMPTVKRGGSSFPFRKQVQEAALLYK